MAGEAPTPNSRDAPATGSSARAVDDPLTLAKAAHIVRAALARRRASTTPGRDQTQQADAGKSSEDHE